MKWTRWFLSLLLIGAFFATAWILQPENAGEIGKTILLALGILTVACIIIGAGYLYAKKGRKISFPSLNGAGKLLGSIPGRDKIGTTLLVGLFLLTLSYAVGGREEWRDSLTWWWGSKIFLPSLFATIGVILFVDAKWRKKINNALIFTTGAMILFSFITATPAITSLLGDTTDKDKNKTTRGAAPSPPENLMVVKEVERTKKINILAPYDTFEEVPLPPTNKLINIHWDIPHRYYGRCLVVITHDGSPDGEIFPCENPERGLRRATGVKFASDDPMEEVPVEVEITYLTTEEK